MSVTESGPMFLNSVNAEGEVKNMIYIAEKFENCIKEVGAQNIIQIITDTTSACKAAGGIVKSKYPHIFWISCVVHTLNLALNLTLKNISAVKNTEANTLAYAQCNWITEISNDALVINNFIMNRSMRLAMFNKYFKMKLLVIAELDLLLELSC